MKKNINKLSGFTLAELMVVFAIIAVVATATIGIYKTQLNIARRYQYYAAFTTLKKAIGNIVADGSIQNSAAAAPLDLVIEKLLPALANSDTTAAKLYSDGTHKSTNNGLCQRMVDVLNTVGPVDCSLIKFMNPFLATEANMTLTNGMRYFNLGSNPIGSGASAYYYVIVDMNGAAGAGLLPQMAKRYTDNDIDVLPFKVYRTGQVLPMLDTGNLVPYTSYMSASVSYVDDSGVTQWISALRSTPYLTAACGAGQATGVSDCGALQKDVNCCTQSICIGGERQCSVTINKPKF